MRYQIRCLVTEKDAMVIVTEDDCDSCRCRANVLRSGFTCAHHVKCDLKWCSSATIRRFMTKTSFVRGAMPCCLLQLPGCLKCWSQRFEAQTVEDIHARNVQHRSSVRDLSRVRISRAYVRPISFCVAVWCCDPTRSSRGLQSQIRLP